MSHEIIIIVQVGALTGNLASPAPSAYFPPSLFPSLPSSFRLEQLYYYNLHHYAFTNTSGTQRCGRCMDHWCGPRCGRSQRSHIAACGAVCIEICWKIG
ncbi:hypothetical protein EDB87DRAFT_1106615 [Lactarius vividus]|nr:hypothetical protein EDB87DRAFT_1106615 [Lactarius vividus]